MSSTKTDMRELMLTPQQRIKRARAKYPEAYALTVNEAIRVQRFDSLIWQFFDTHPEFRRIEHIGEGDRQRDRVVYLYNDDSISLLKAFFTVKRLSLANAYALASRVLSQPWFEVMSVLYVGDNKPQGQASLNTSDGYKGIILEDWREFYKVWSLDDESNAQPIREALKLDDTYLYLCTGERDILQLIKGIAEYDNAPFTTTQEEGFIAIKSTPQSTALVSIGEKAVLEAKYDELNELFDILSSTGEHVYLRGRQLNSNEFISLDKLLRQINSVLHQCGYMTKAITITLEEFMEFRGLSDKKAAREQFERAIALLYEVSLNYNGLESRYLQTKARIHNSKVALILTDLFFESLRVSGSVALIPQGFFSLDGKSGNAYKLGITLSDNRRRNIGKPNENRMSIAKLLEATTLNLADKIEPKYYKRQIIEPFFTALNKASAKGFSYTLVHRGGTPLTPLEQFEIHHNYELFISCLVDVVWDKEPEYYKSLRERKVVEAEAHKRGKIKGIEAKAKAESQGKKPVKKR